VSTHVNHCQHT